MTQSNKIIILACGFLRCNEKVGLITLLPEKRAMLGAYI